jgi:hypothetical protein
MVRKSTPVPQPKTLKVSVHIILENNSRFVRGKSRSLKEIEDYCLSEYKAKKLENDGWEYELTFQYEHDEDLENQIEDLAVEMSSEADSRNGFIECHFSEVGTDRSWL